MNKIIGFILPLAKKYLFGQKDNTDDIITRLDDFNLIIDIQKSELTKYQSIIDSQQLALKNTSNDYIKLENKHNLTSTFLIISFCINLVLVYFTITLP